MRTILCFSLLFAATILATVLSTERSTSAQLRTEVLSCTPPPPGMVSWWAGEGNAIDDRGENNGTLNGATFAAGEVGQAFNFDGSSEVTVADNGNLNLQTFTLDAWVFQTVGDGQNDIIVSKEGPGLAYEVSIRGPANPGGSIPVGNLAFFIGGISGLPNDESGWVDGGGAVPLNTWTHVALTFNGNSAQTYINGVLKRTVNGLSGSVSASSGPFRIGSRDPAQFVADPNARFNGSIDEVEVFSRALDITEIQAIFNAGSFGKCRPRCYGPLTGLISWWDADDDPFDRQGTNHGTLVNGATFGTGKVGRAFSFDGVDDYVRIPISLSLQTVSNAITIDMWVKLNSLPSAPGALLLSNHIQAFGSPISGVNLNVSPSGTVTFQTRLNNTCCQNVTSNGVLQSGIWQHIAAVWDGANLRLYIDGTPDNIAPASGTLQMNRDIFLGINADDFFGGTITHQVNGLIDEVEIFNRALDITEIQAINNTAHAGKCKACLPVLNNTTFWYPGDGNAKETVGNGSTGTLNNGAAFGFGKVGQAFSLNQGGDTGAYVEIPDHPIFHFGSNDFSIAFWTNLDQIKDTMFIHQLNGATAGGWEFNYQTFFGELFFNRDTNNAAIHRAWSPQANTWYHLAVTRTGGTYKLFVNGVQLGADQPDANPVANVNGPLRIGSFETVNTYNLIGRMDEVQIFDVARTQTEIQSIVAAGISGMCKLGGTNVGPNTQSRAGDATLTFGNLTGNGIVTYQTLPLYQAGPMPFGYSDPLHIADISTTATFTGNAQVCFNLQAVSDMTTFNQLRVLHLEGNLLIDRTSSHSFAQRSLCATTPSLSPFVISQNPNAAPTAANGNIGGLIADSSGAPVSGVTINLSGSESRETITDSSGNYSFDNVETNGFYTVTPSRVNYTFSPGNRSFSLLGVHTDASFTASANCINRLTTWRARRCRSD